MNSGIKVLVLTDFSSGYSRNLLRGIVRYAQQTGGWTFYRVPLYYKGIQREDGIIEWANRWNVDAVIVQNSDIRIGYLREKLSVPIIAQNCREHIPGVCNLAGDYIGTGKMAAEYFIRKGYTRFAYYGTHDAVWSLERGLGFEQRLKENGFEPATMLEASYSRAQWMYDPDALGAWLVSLPKPVAVFTCDDYFALLVSETCRIFGLEIPSQVAVLGVDNDELLCNISSPSLSSVAIEAENGGYTAGKILHDLIENRIGEPRDITVNPVQVFTRGSTQMYAIKDKYIMQAVRYIEGNYAKPIGVPDLLGLVPLSRRVFEKRFRKHTGMPVYQFLQRMRIEKFAAELIETQKSIETIAIECGFEDYRNVSRVFVRYKDMTPSKYRRRYRKKNESG